MNRQIFQRRNRLTNQEYEMLEFRALNQRYEDVLNEDFGTLEEYNTTSEKQYSSLEELAEDLRDELAGDEQEMFEVLAKMV